MATYHEGLSPSQLEAFTLAIKGQSFFLTGSAGTGKSELLKRLVKYWTQNRIYFAMTATTGIAAVNVQGRTFHSYLSLLVGDENLAIEDIYRRISENTYSYKKYSKKLNSLKVFVIDEVSMMSLSLLKIASDIISIVRRNSNVFGGLQVILVGDFFQLPPVKQTENLFETSLFYEVAPKRVILQEIFRQSDKEFSDTLGRIRCGEMNEADEKLLRSRLHADVSKFGVEPTELWSTNKDVDKYNSDKLEQIRSDSVFFERIEGLWNVSGSTTAHTIILDKFLKDIGVPEKIELKGPEINDADNDAATNNVSYDSSNVNTTMSSSSSPSASTGAQVLLTYNLDQDRGLINGTRGVVIGFESMPVAGSKTKSDLRNPSLDKNLAYLKNVKHPKVLFLDMNENPVTILVPYVRLTRNIQLEDDEKDHVTPYCWHIPLRLAWATTVHKSQGQSLTCMKASIDRSVFAYGQAYVALSRARSLLGLSLSAFEPSVVRADPKVVSFYEQEYGTLKPL